MTTEIPALWQVTFRDSIGSVQLTDMMPHPRSGIKPQTAIDQAARVKLEVRSPEDENKIIHYMSTHGHDTPFEAVNLSFICALR